LLTNVIFDMAISVFKLINLVIILVMLVFVTRYSWSLFFGSGYEPAEWEHKKKKGQLSPALVRCMDKFEDKVRFYAIWLQIERIKSESIQGAFAELGVYKGESARLIRLMDPGRKFHLFDTFSGLPEPDLKLETGEAATYTNVNFKDTNLEKVIAYIGGDPSLLLVHEGYFPETAIGLENEIFAFVNLDADLYKPTIEGLKFFYPRLSSGGVIFIHDYNYKWEGLKKAVDEFCQNIPEKPALLPDLYGSVMIIKS
jgi:O-methyltransferase